MQDYSGYGQPPTGQYGTTAPLPPMPPRPPRRRIGLLSYLAVAVVAGALGAGTVVALYHPSSNASAAPQSNSGGSAPSPLPSSAIPAPSSSGAASAGSETAIVSKVQPGLVIIDTMLQYNSEEAAGTGMVISSSGLVLTNNHVIEDSTSIKATDEGNGRTYTAKVVGYDETGDIALIQLQNASGLRTVPIGDSAAVKTGDSVVAMGNAEGQSQIVPATGQVTAVNQTITASDQGGSITTETLHGMIETNADIVSGDSGGPLANSAGQVIGIDTAGSGEGFSVQQQSTEGFAIPIDTALSVARQIGADQASSTITIGYPPFMGIFISTSTSSNPQVQDEQQGGGGFGGNGFGGGGFGNGFGGNGGQSCYTNNSDVPAPSTIASVSSGTLILGTICGGPAEAAGMTAGSVITAVNGQAIGSAQDLTSVVSKYRPGTTVSVTWVSPSGRRSTTDLHLTVGPPL